MEPQAHNGTVPLHVEPRASDEHSDKTLWWVIDATGARIAPWYDTQEKAEEHREAYEAWSATHMAEGGIVAESTDTVCICGHGAQSHTTVGGEGGKGFDFLCRECDEGRNFHKYQVAMHDGAALVEDVGPGVEAIIGEAGPEAVVPLDDPAAVEIMAEAIAEGTGEDVSGTDGAEEVAEAAEAVAEAAEEIAAVAETEVEVAAEMVDSVTEVLERLADFAEEAVEDVTEEMAEVAEESIEASEEVATEATESAEEVVEEVVDTPPRRTHWSERPLREMLGGRRK